MSKNVKRHHPAGGQAGLLRPNQSACIVVLLALLFSSISSTPSLVSHSQALQTETNFPSSYDILQYPLPNGSSQPLQITTDNSGRVWFVEQTSNQIGMFNPVNKQFSEYTIPTKNALPESIAVDAEGNTWFAELGANQLGELVNQLFSNWRVPNSSRSGKRESADHPE